MLGTWLCAVWQARMSEGKELPPSAWPTLTTHHHTPANCTLCYSNHTTGTVQCLLYSYYGTFISAYEIVTLLRGFTCLCTQYWDTFIINICPCIFSSPLWITLHCQMHPLSMHNLYFSLSASCWSTETAWDLQEITKCIEFPVISWLYIQKMITVNVVTCQEGAVQFSDKIHDLLPNRLEIDSELWHYVLFTASYV